MATGGKLDKMNVTMNSGGRYYDSRDKYRRADLRKTSMEEFGSTPFDTKGYYDNSPGRKPRKKWNRTDKRAVWDEV